MIYRSIWQNPTDSTCLFVRVRMLFKARLSRLRHYCSHDAGSRRKRRTDEDELQYLNKDLMTQAVNSSRDEVAEVLP